MPRSRPDRRVPLGTPTKARFSGSAFLELKESIRHDGENQAPIRIRPLRPKADTAAVLRYELAYGHRQLRACRDFEITVRAIVEELT